MKKYHLFLFLFALATGFVSCSSDDDSSESAEGNARVRIELTDAPGDYAHVYVEVEDVMIKTSTEGTDEEGWESLEGVRTGEYDLLTLTGGMTELLVDTEIPAGYLHQIRLVLGDKNSVVLNGTEQPLLLKIPSGQESGLKLQVNQELEADAEYTFIMDFDVDKSIVTTGAGGFNLKPVIRVSVEENSGAIVGSVHPTTEQVLITVENANTSASAYTNAEGNFMVHGLSAGTYKVTATPAAGVGLNPVVVNNVKVEQGSSVNLDPLYLDGE